MSDNKDKQIWVRYYAHESPDIITNERFLEDSDIPYILKSTAEETVKPIRDAIQNYINTPVESEKSQKDFKLELLKSIKETLERADA